MRVRLTRRAARDLEAISDYIRDRNPSAADNVRKAIEAALRVIATYPHSGRSYGEGVRRLTLPRLPYLIFYDLDEAADEIRILTIRHAARRPDA